MSMINFEQIQEGRMSDALSSPDEIASVIARHQLQIPDASVREQQTKNEAKGVWNRDVQVDFQSAEIVERCIFMCLRYYRTDQWKQKGCEGKDYQSLMQTKYDKRFTAAGLANIYQTLVQWNMNTRGAKLVEEDEFYKTVLLIKPEVDKLKRFKFPDFCNETLVGEIEVIIRNLFRNLKLTKNSRFVTVSKTLHFLHPQLIVPMDRSYTANYFHNYRMPDIPKDIDKQASWNIAFHKELCTIYMKHKEMIDRISIETKYPVTKLLDNLLIGFNMYRDRFIKQFNTSFILS